MTSILPSLPASNISNFQADTKTAVDSSVTPFDSVLEKQMAATDQSPKQDNVKKTTSKPDSKATDNEKEDEKQTDKPQTAAQPDLLSFIMSAQNTNTAINQAPVANADTAQQTELSGGKQMLDLANLNADKSAEKLLTTDQLAQAKAAISEMADNQPMLIDDAKNQPSITPTTTPAAVSTALPTSPTVATTPIYQVAPSLNQSGWDQAISQRVVWMANQQLQNATITINPEHLGPIQVQVQIDNQQQASVQFISAQPEVRQALQNAIPTLSNMLEQSGIQLGHSDVSSQGSGSNGQQQGKANPFQGSETVIDNSLIDLPTSSSSGQGLINVSA
jgi:flagellar hook-length control protein FliK